VAKFAGVDITVQQIKPFVDNKTTEYLAKFPFGRVPALETEEGNIYESNAVAFYIASKHLPSLLGGSDLEKALILQFMFAFETEFASLWPQVIYPTMGWRAYDEKTFTEAFEAVKGKLKVLN
jgi:elongation factor 1-gamma